MTEFEALILGGHADRAPQGALDVDELACEALASGVIALDTDLPLAIAHLRQALDGGCLDALHWLGAAMIDWSVQNTHLDAAGCKALLFEGLSWLLLAVLNEDAAAGDLWLNLMNDLPEATIGEWLALPLFHFVTVH